MTTDDRTIIIQLPSLENPISIIWVDALRAAECAADPRYPDGIDLDLSRGAEKACTVALPHPAKRCGCYKIHCIKCGMVVAITTSGRADDPRSIKFACKPLDDKSMS